MPQSSRENAPLTLLLFRLSFVTESDGLCRNEARTVPMTEMSKKKSQLVVAAWRQRVRAKAVRAQDASGQEHQLS